MDEAEEGATESDPTPESEGPGDRLSDFDDELSPQEYDKEDSFIATSDASDTELAMDYVGRSAKLAEDGLDKDAMPSEAELVAGDENESKEDEEEGPTGTAAGTVLMQLNPKRTRSATSTTRMQENKKLKRKLSYYQPKKLLETFANLDKGRKAVTKFTKSNQVAVTKAEANLTTPYEKLEKGLKQNRTTVYLGTAKALPLLPFPTSWQTEQDEAVANNNSDLFLELRNLWFGRVVPAHIEQEFFDLIRPSLHGGSDPLETTDDEDEEDSQGRPASKKPKLA